ncbi:YfgM family protein [Salinimonas lutimaris]|uniref:YfgM family protein n=1 Tax=Salinimonas lutimaris TaxID=914153 RepID=UPI0010C0B7B2|nr:YfgM family protein [Salinimonas lutimaris]
MEQFATEEQQVEAIKRFWKDNGTAIIVGAVLGLGGLWGWRYYSDTQIEAKEQASAQYQSAIEQLENDGANSVEQFISKHPDTGYSNIAGLVLAGKMVNDNNLDGAASQLKQVMDTTSDKHLKSLAGVRLARVQIQQQQADQALNTLNAINDESFKALVAEIKGDAFVQQAKMDDARTAYTEALEADDQNQLVQMKLDNLSVATGS